MRERDDSEIEERRMQYRLACERNNLGRRALRARIRAIKDERTALDSERRSVAVQQILASLEANHVSAADRDFRQNVFNWLLAKKVLDDIPPPAAMTSHVTGGFHIGRLISRPVTWNTRRSMCLRHPLCVPGISWRFVFCMHVGN